jgi:hypothetical protein
MTIIADVLAYDPDKVKPGWIAFFVVMALVVATFFLWRSMNTQLGKIQVPPGASFGPGTDDRRRAAGQEGEPLPPASPASPDSPPSADDDER